MGSGWGTRVHPWLIHVNMWQKSAKVISLQLKFLKKEWGRAWKLIFVLLCGLRVQGPNDAEPGKAGRMWPDRELWTRRETPAALFQSGVRALWPGLPHPRLTQLRALHSDHRQEVES